MDRAAPALFRAALNGQRNNVILRAEAPNDAARLAWETATKKSA
jgi:hypothetical protein